MVIQNYLVSDSPTAPSLRGVINQTAVALIEEILPGLGPHFTEQAALASLSEKRQDMALYFPEAWKKLRDVDVVKTSDAGPGLFSLLGLKKAVAAKPR